MELPAKLGHPVRREILARPLVSLPVAIVQIQARHQTGVLPEILQCLGHMGAELPEIQVQLRCLCRGHST